MLKKIPETLKDKYFLLIVAAFLGAFWFYWTAITQNGGNTFYSPLTIWHHPLPDDMMRNGFWKNLLLYYHTQSPFYTLYSYLLMDMAPNQGEWAFYAFHTLLGIGAFYSLYRLGLAMGASRLVMAAVFTVFVTDPGFHVLFSQAWNDFVTMCLVSIMAYRCHRLFTAPGFANSFWFFWALAFVVATRTVFHPVLFALPVFAVVFFYFREHRATVAKSFVLPFIFLVWPYVRTWLMLGMFSLGSSQASLAMKANAFEFHMPFETRVEGIEKGYFSDFVLCYWMGPGPYTYKGNVYTTEYCSQRGNEYMQAHLTDLFSPELLARYADVPLLSEPRFHKEFFVPFPGNQNSFHSQVMADRLKRDSLGAIIHYPEYYFFGVQHALWQYFRPSSDYHFLIALNARKLPLWMGDAWIKHLPFDPRHREIGLKTENALKPHYVSASISPYLLIGLTTLLVYAGARAYGLRRPLIPAAVLIVYGGLMTLEYYFISNIHEWSKQKQLMMLVLVPAFLFMLVLLARGIKQRRRLLPEQMVYLFMLCTILYFTAFVIALPGSEQERYRMGINGLYLVLMSIFSTHALRRARQWWRSRKAA